uniref:Uncharacterized protein n=1 Tax=Oryza meridionalis TaxID=40149 RepID=A0A0E0C2P9_9ORYZ
MATTIRIDLNSAECAQLHLDDTLNLSYHTEGSFQCDEAFSLASRGVPSKARGSNVVQCTAGEDGHMEALGVLHARSSAVEAIGKVTADGRSCPVVELRASGTKTKHGNELSRRLAKGFSRGPEVGGLSLVHIRVKDEAFLGLGSKKSWAAKESAAAACRACNANGRRGGAL